MKLPFSLSIVILAGCAAKSPYDVSPAQVKAHAKSAAPIDLAHLPPGATKQEKTFKKGETLPDGSIAKGGEHVSLVQLDASKPGPGPKRQMFLINPGSGAK